MINIQKSYSVQIGSIQSILSSLVQFGPMQSIRSYLYHSVHFTSIQSTSVHSVHFRPILSTLVLFSLRWFYLVHFSPIQSILPTLSYLVHSNPIWSILSTLVLFGPHWFNLIHFVHLSLIQSTLVLLRPLQFSLSTSVLFSPIWSCSVHLSTLVLICPLGPPCFFRSYYVHSVHFVPFRLLQSILVHFDLFMCTYIMGKKHVWVKTTYSKSKFIIKNINLKFVISKILSIVFIVIMFLLSHIIVAFQFTSKRLNLSESLSKHKSYEYTNVIIREVIHLF